MAIVAPKTPSAVDPIADLRASLTRPKPVKPTNELGKDDFLKLLITQLKNQDPTNPMDNKDMIAQQAQFSSLEQITNMNTSLTSLVALLKTNTQGFVGYLGKNVTAGPQAEGEEPVAGRVDAVRFKDGSPVLIVSGREINPTTLLSVE